VQVLLSFSFPPSFALTGSTCQLQEHNTGRSCILLEGERDSFAFSAFSSLLLVGFAGQKRALCTGVIGHPARGDDEDCFFLVFFFIPFNRVFIFYFLYM
jgi:hypothetical protein